MINISGYDVIYNETVYKCIDVNPIFDYNGSEPPAKYNPKFIDVCCIDQDGLIVFMHDETFMFRFIRKAGDAHV